MTALDTLKCGLWWSSDCLDEDMVWCLWSSIMARQQATGTVRAAAKHTVLRSQRTSLKVDVFSHICEGKTRGFGTAKLCTSLLSDNLSQLVCWSKIAKEIGKKNKTKQNKPINTHPTESKTLSENSAVILAAVFQEFVTVFESAGKNVNDCMQMNKMSISKYKSTINNHLWLSGSDSVQLTNASLKEMQLRHTQKVCVYSWEHV